MSYVFASLCFFSFLSPANAQYDWGAVTVDNDSFVNSDNGYTNGFYVSLFETGETTEAPPANDFWLNPLLWSLPNSEPQNAINAYMIGQTMVTPSDISIANPGPNEIPYSAVLALTNTYVTFNATTADQVSMTIGMVGPAALGEEVQTAVHELIGAVRPQGWDTQLENELVFQISRARAWRSWVSKAENADLTFSSELNAGTITSGLNAGVMFRFGQGLQDTYVSTLFNNSRMINPVTSSGGRSVYIRVRGGYLFNQIYTDGNTFRDSPSIDFDPGFLEISGGFSYSWKNYAVSFALTNGNVLQSGSEEETLENLTQYGALTFCWKI